VRVSVVGSAAVSSVLARPPPPSVSACTYLWPLWWPQNLGQPSVHTDWQSPGNSDIPEYFLKTFYVMGYLIYWQSICRTIWNDVMSNKTRAFTLRHNKQCQLGQSEESFFYCWLRTLAMFYITWFPVFVGASDTISSELSIHLFAPDIGKMLK